MNTLIFGVILIALVALVLAMLKNMGRSSGDDGPWPFYAKKPLTPPEQVLYHRLVAAMPECIVLAQVQLSQVLGVRSGVNYYEWHNRINLMSLDFLLLLKDSTIVAAIELDEKSHETAKRIVADTKKEKALRAAGVPLVRWNVRVLPDRSAIRQAFTK